MPPSDRHHTQPVKQFTGGMTTHTYSGPMQMEIQPVTTQTNPPTEDETYVFSPRELRRLAAYRAAVVARFYTDECETSASTSRLISKSAPQRSTVSR